LENNPWTLTVEVIFTKRYRKTILAGIYVVPGVGIEPTLPLPGKGF
jgi:hypothetical protein